MEEENERERKKWGRKGGKIKKESWKEGLKRKNLKVGIGKKSLKYKEGKLKGSFSYPRIVSTNFIGRDVDWSAFLPFSPHLKPFLLLFS